MKKNVLMLLTTVFLLPVFSMGMTIDLQPIDANNVRATLSINLKPGEILYKDSIMLSIDTPAAQLTEWHADKDAIYQFDEATNQKKLVYTDLVTFNATIKKKIEKPESGRLHIIYQTNSHGMQHDTFTIFADKNTGQIAETTASEVRKTKQEKPTNQSFIWRLTQFLSQLLTQSNSSFLQLILVFFLGMLLSLTPCIYPMIPITVGILHNNENASIAKNFSRATAYSSGIATTFALMGLGANYMRFTAGALLVNPIFVILLVSILGYFAFSMFGFYDMYIPRFMQPNTQKSGNSLFSAFLFGAASGSIASPCVSPGLALVLSVAALSASALFSFLLLFAFGIGLSMPLLIVGTFTSSINLLPRSGMWMLEVKKFFGLLLLAVCFYYLSNIIPLHIVLILFALTIFALGIYYIHTGLKSWSPFWKKTNIVIGILFIAGSIATLPHLYMLKYRTHNQQEMWLQDYQAAKQLAIEQNKKLFIDFWAQYCSICKAINKSVMADPKVQQALQQFVPVMIDGTHETNTQYSAIKEKFAIQGFPTFIIVDPVNETVIKRWGSELYNMPREEFIQQLQNT
jgi:thiol:disulfide interchange protein DsbD